MVRPVQETVESKSKFLQEDYYNALRYLFEGAVAWEAARKKQSDSARHQSVFGMYASLVEARALYEFFFSDREGKDDARAYHFAKGWSPRDVGSLNKDYMQGRKPVNKRLFHLVYGRSNCGGQPPINEQVLAFARALRSLAEQFANQVDEDFKGTARSALRRALNEAAEAAKHYGIPDPL